MATSITNTSISTDSITAPTVNANTIDPTQGFLSIAQQNASGEGGEILLAGSNGNANAVIDNNNGTIRILQGANTRISVDTNGYVTTPNQPGCMIYCQSQDITWVAGTQILYGNNSATSNTSIKAWDTTNSFNMTNSQYTAPVAGKYYVSFTANGVYASAVVPRAHIRVNGSSLGHGQHIRGNSTITGDLDHRTYAGIISLAANDIVTVHSTYGTWDTFGCNYFCIYKLS